MTTSNSDPYGRSTGGSTPGTSENGTVKQKAQEDIQNVKKEMDGMAREKAQAGQHQIKNEADALSDAIDAAASNLDDHDREGLARYARKMSRDIASAAEQIEGRSVDELAQEAKRLAQKNPALFMLGSIAVGFGMSRFFKASAERDHPESSDRTNTSRTSAYGADGASTGMPPQRPGANSYGTSSSPYNDGRNIL